MHRHLISIALSFSFTLACGAELFPEGKQGAIATGTVLDSATTAGGYAIYPGAGRWKLDESKTDLVIGPSTLPMGIVRLSHVEDSTLVAGQNIRVNLAQRINSAVWRGGPCSQEQLYKRIGRNGSAETCLVVNARNITLGNRSVVFFSVLVEQAGTNGNYYQVDVGLNSEIFGFGGSAVHEWQPQALASHPRKKAFFDRLITWAQTLAAATDQAFHEKAQGGQYLGAVPSYLTLMAIPDDLRGKGHSLRFLGEVVALGDKPGIGAIAYSPTGPGVTRWSAVWNQATQADADAQAVKNCERERAPSRPPCEVYRPSAVEAGK